MEEAKSICYLSIDGNGIGSLVVTAEDYPGKVAFLIINEMFREFYKEFNQMYLDSVLSLFFIIVFMMSHNNY